MRSYINGLGRVAALSIVIWGVAVSAPGELQGATFCRQTFLYLGNTLEDTTTLVFYEFLTGECETRRTYRLRIGPSGLLTPMDRTRDYSAPPLCNDSNWIGKKLEDPEQATLQDNMYSIWGVGTIKAPEYDSAFAAEFFREIEPTMVAPYSILDPPLTDLNLELIYSLPTGIYRNYAIRDVIYMRQSRLLFIVTSCPYEKAGGDTLHGILIYRVVD